MLSATAFATDWYLSEKALLATELLYKKAKDKAIQLAQKAGEILSKESVILKMAEGFEAKIGHDVAENLSKMAAEHVASGSEVIKKFNIGEYCHEIGDLAKIEEAIKLFGDMPSAMSKDGPLRKVLECGKKGLEPGKLHTARGAMYEVEKAVELTKKGEKVLEFGKKLNMPGKSLREFDISTSTKLIECKNIDWNDYSEKALNDIISKICEQNNIAQGLGMIFELHSPYFPGSIKDQLISKVIKFIEK